MVLYLLRYTEENLRASNIHTPIYCYINLVGKEIIFICRLNIPIY